MKFVIARSTSDLDFKSASFGSTFCLIYEHEVLINVLYRQKDGSDEFMFLFYNLSNGLHRRQEMFIKHTAIPPVLLC